MVDLLPVRELRSTARARGVRRRERLGAVSVLVDRLQEMIDPFRIIGRRYESSDPNDPGDLISVEEFLEAEPLADYEANHFARDVIYDLRRVSYFYRRFLAGETVDPIELDCRCDRGHVYPEPLILDGYHRFAGAILARSTVIKVSFGGRLDLLRYLQGRRKTCPV